MGECSSLAWTPRLKIYVKMRKRVWVLALGWRSPDRSPFLQKLALILKIGHQGAPARRWICLPPRDTPCASVFLSVAPSLHLLSSFCPLSSPFLQFLSFPYHLVSKKGKAEWEIRLQNATRIAERGKKSSPPLELNPLLVRRAGGRGGRGKSGACLKSLAPTEY